MTDNKLEIKAILNEYNITNVEINLIRETNYNVVYKVSYNNNDYVLRIGNKKSIDDVKTETKFISYLHKNDFPSPKVIENKKGKLFVCINNTVSVLFSFIKGKHIEISKDKLPTSNVVLLVGKELAKFHEVSKNFNLPFDKSSRFKNELVRVIKNKDLFIKSFSDAGLFILEINDAINFIDKSKNNTGIIHNDLRYHNVFFNKSESKIIGIIDYDWSCNGQIIKDVAHTALEWSFPDGATSPDMDLFNKLIEGYNSISEIKIKIDSNLYKWVWVSALSDTATYISDRIHEFNKKEDQIHISSSMYKKAKYFKNLLN